MITGGRGKKALTEDVKVFIVQRYALFQKATEIQRAIKDELGIEVTFEQVKLYNLDTAKAQRMTGKALKAIFAETRKQFLEEVAQHPAAHRAYRVRRLGEMAEKSMDKGNYPLAAKLFEQVAKEVGGAFTNDVNVKGKVDHNHTGQVEHVASIEEKRNVLADRLREGLERAAQTSVH